jgi:ribosomal protein L7/L12
VLVGAGAHPVGLPPERLTIVAVARSGSGYASFMPDESRRSWIIRTVQRWRRRGNRYIWLISLALVIAACGAAISVPSARPELLAGILAVGCGGWMASERRSSRREREALAARLATLTGGHVPAHVIDLLLAGKKVQAVKYYREQTGTSLKEAKDLIDSL